MYVVCAHQNDIQPLLDIPVNQSLEQIVVAQLAGGCVAGKGASVQVPTFSQIRKEDDYLVIPIACVSMLDYLSTSICRTPNVLSALARS